MWDPARQPQLAAASSLRCNHSTSISPHLSPPSVPLPLGVRSPLYSLAECEDDGQQRGSGAVMSAAFEDLYYQNNVDVHISGHVHAYERQHPVYRNKLTADAPTYIVSGAGGNSENHSHLGHKPGALWSAYSNDEDFGIGIFTVTRSSFEWKYLRGAGGAVLDSVTLTK